MKLAFEPRRRCRDPQHRPRRLRRPVGTCAKRSADYAAPGCVLSHDVERFDEHAAGADAFSREASVVRSINRELDAAASHSFAADRRQRRADCRMEASVFTCTPYAAITARCASGARKAAMMYSCAPRRAAATTVARSAEACASISIATTSTRRRGEGGAPEPGAVRAVGGLANALTREVNVKQMRDRAPKLPTSRCG